MTNQPKLEDIVNGIGVIILKIGWELDFKAYLNGNPEMAIIRNDDDPNYQTCLYGYILNRSDYNANQPENSIALKFIHEAPLNMLKRQKGC